MVLVTLATCARTAAVKRARGIPIERSNQLGGSDISIKMTQGTIPRQVMSRCSETIVHGQDVSANSNKTSPQQPVPAVTYAGELADMLQCRKTLDFVLTEHRMDCFHPRKHQYTDSFSRSQTTRLRHEGTPNAREKNKKTDDTLELLTTVTIFVPAFAIISKQCARTAYTKRETDRRSAQ